ncbi:MAG: peptidylprolyl isomerase [Coriobacteriia bacterium]
MRKTNTYVCINYVGSFPSGEVFDDRRDGSPLKVLLGSAMIPKGVEKELLDMEDGEERTILVSPEEGYGPYENDAVFKIPLNTLPDWESLPVGKYIHWYGKNERPAYAKVVEVTDTHAVLDLNHPLAGKELEYWVKIVECE